MKYGLILLAFLSCKLSFGQSNSYEEILQYYNSEQHFNGAVLVATNGDVNYSQGIGLANRNARTKISNTTIFRIASITKAFTAVLILQLYEKGKLDLKAPFGKYYPTYKGIAKNSVTIEHLLTYSSGIPDAAAKIGMKSFEVPLRIDEYIDKYCSGDLIDKPGENSVYSNTEYIILTKIIENITQKSYETVLKENILLPLQMRHSGMLRSNNRPKGLSDSYTINDSAKESRLDEPYYAENYFGAGAMYSTVGDLLLFDEGIFKGKLLNPSNTALLIKPNAKLNNVAFGVWYADGYGTFSKPFIYRTGGILGACSNWIHTIDDKKTIIVFNNTNGTNLYEMSEQLYLISNGKKATVGKKSE